MSARINTNQTQPFVARRLPVQQQQARLSGHGNANLICEHQSSAPLELLTSQEPSNVRSQFAPIRFRQKPKKWNPLLQYLLPVSGQFGCIYSLKPVVHADSLRSVNNSGLMRR